MNDQPATAHFVTASNGGRPSVGDSSEGASEQSAALRSSGSGGSRGRADCGHEGSGNAIRRRAASDDEVLSDLPALAAVLSQRLHVAGLPVSPARAVTFAEALTLIGPVSRSRLYFTARTVFVSAPAHLPAFDRVFASVFEDGGGKASVHAEAGRSVRQADDS